MIKPESSGVTCLKQTRRLSKDVSETFKDEEARPFPLVSHASETVVPEFESLLGLAGGGGGGGLGACGRQTPKSEGMLPAPAAKISGRKEFLVVVGQIGNASFAPNAQSIQSLFAKPACESMGH